VDSPEPDAPAPDPGASGAEEQGASDAEAPGGQAGAPTARRAATTAGKGRPTPKRSEAERRRRQPFTAPKDRKEAGRAARERDRQARARRTQAMRRGEEWAMPARDYVDSRRRVSEFYMYGLIVLLILLFVRTPIVQTIVPLIVVGAVLVMLGEGIFIGRRVRSLVEQRLPGESTRGVRMYAAMRALQIRQLRMPKPRIKPGDSF
jgi:hypothetical protein